MRAAARRGFRIAGTPLRKNPLDRGAAMRPVFLGAAAPAPIARGRGIFA